MKNKKLESKIQQEVSDFIASRKSLQMATLTEAGDPYVSYAPFAVDQDCFYVLLSEVAVHACNLQCHPTASVMLIEDEDTAAELFARIRVSYHTHAQLIPHSDPRWQHGIAVLAQRHGTRIRNLSELADFKLFCLYPQGGRYVKGFGRAYALAPGSLCDGGVDHMRDGHTKRATA